MVHSILGREDFKIIEPQDTVIKISKMEDRDPGSGGTASEASGTISIYLRCDWSQKTSGGHGIELQLPRIV